ncbi:MAG: adenylate/guanylate cyclase domain-containing protein, partial [Bacteroidota bacterium]
MKNLIPDFIQDKFLEGQNNGTFKAYAMAIDLSGFTALTNGLMKLGNRGAEQLSYILNEIFAPLVEVVYEKGGFIPYYAGDAFTALFPDVGDNASPARLVEAAQGVRNLFSQREYKFDEYTIGLKIGLSYGEVMWGVVGGDKKAYYFRGEAIDNGSVCQLKANNQDIIIDSALREKLVDQQLKLEEVSSGCYRLMADISPQHSGWEHKSFAQPMKRDVLLHFLPEAVIDYNQEGEFRDVIAIFLSFEGVTSHQMMDEFATILLNQVDIFSSYFKEIDFGDKGGVMVCFFGAPVSFENNSDRALEFMYGLKNDLLDLQAHKGLQYKAGITFGTAYTGIVGGKERCQYAAVGNRVNLAARLMVQADWGEVLVDAEMKKNHNFAFQHHGDIKYKGIADNVPTYKLIGRDQGLSISYGGDMVGREEELNKLVSFAEPLKSKKSVGIAYVYGEAGIGKSRLTHELRKNISRDQDLEWYFCQSDQILRKPFNPFI